MQVADSVSTRLINKGADNEVPVSEILINGAPTGAYVSGAVVECAVWAGDRLLTLMTDDVPSEEMLGIHLFDKNLKLVDSALLGAPYSTGSFSLLELGSDRIRFRFIGDTDWSVEILDSPRLRAPFVADALGVKRRFGFTRHFIVRGDPTPQSR